MALSGKLALIMENLLRIIILVFIVSSCYNENSLAKKSPTQLDSLIGFDTIVSIYSYTSLPVLLDKEPSPYTIITLYDHLIIDSTHHKWTNDKNVINNFCKTFPRLDSLSDSNWSKNAYTTWDTSALFFREILLVTKKRTYIVGWYMSNKEKMVGLDAGVYLTSKAQIEKAAALLDKRIILKEIYKRDLLKYNINDLYNQMYFLSQDTARPEKIFVFITER